MNDARTTKRFDVITVFPELFDPFLRTSLLGRAVEAGTVAIGVTNLRDFGLGPHLSVDDEPYGGGAGMVMRPEPIARAVGSVRASSTHSILLSPRGKLFTQDEAARLSCHDHLVLVCGRYEGVDERVAEHVVDEELSIGDYVLYGGEVAAMVVIEAVSRLVPGVLGNADSLRSESHAAGLLEYPQYTRPSTWEGHEVPDVLLSGDHGAVAAWRGARARELTRLRRPELMQEEDEEDR